MKNWVAYQTSHRQSTKTQLDRATYFAAGFGEDIVQSVLESSPDDLFDLMKRHYRVEEGLMVCVVNLRVIKDRPKAMKFIVEKKLGVVEIGNMLSKSWYNDDNRNNLAEYQKWVRDQAFKNLMNLVRYYEDGLSDANDKVSQKSRKESQIFLSEVFDLIRIEGFSNKSAIARYLKENQPDRFPSEDAARKKIERALTRCNRGAEFDQKCRLNKANARAALRHK